MTSIITGDIINSRKADSTLWLPILENALNKYSIGKTRMEIFRGDSFQVEVAIHHVFEALVYIKTSIKTIPKLDVRVSVGVGEKTFEGKSISTSTGQAFIFSGEAFEELKKQNISIKTPWIETTKELKLLLDLMIFIIEKWNVNYSSTIKTVLENPNATQQELSSILGKKQSQISRELKKAGFGEIQRAIIFCTDKLISKC